MGVARVGGLACLIACAACTEASLEIDLSMAGERSRYVVLPETGGPACGDLAKIPTRGRLPPIVREREQREYLLELELEDGPIDFADEEAIRVVRLNFDAGDVYGSVAPFPKVLRVWSMSTDGKSEQLDVEAAEKLTKDLYIAPEGCLDRIADACNGFIVCPEYEIVSDIEIEAEGPEVFDAARGVDGTSYVVARGQAFIARVGGLERIEHTSEIRAMTSDEQGTLFLDEQMCLLSLEPNLTLTEVSCRTSTIALRGLEREIARGSDGRVWIAYPFGVFRVDGEGWERQWAKRGLDDSTIELELLDDNQHVVLDADIQQSLYYGDGSNVIEPQPRAESMTLAGDELLFVEQTNQQPIIRRVDVPASLEAHDLVIKESARTPSGYIPLILRSTEHGVFMGMASGESLTLDRWVSCPPPQLARIPQEVTSYEDGFIVVADNTLDFNYLVYTNPRVYMIRATPPMSCRKR